MYDQVEFWEKCVVMPFWNGVKMGLTQQNGLNEKKIKTVSDLVLWQNPDTNRKFNNQLTTQKDATKNFDYTMIANRLRTLSWSNHLTGVV